MITEKVDINDFYWGIKTKFKLEIGIRNKLTNQYKPSFDGLYPEIVWFPQGIFLISTFNTSLGVDNCTISLQGKDKMCMLNGELGGQLFASVDFGAEETETKIMLKSPVSTNTSDILMARKYYFKPKEEELPEEIFTNDSNYCMILNNVNGIYYKSNNKYIKMKKNEDGEIQNVRPSGKNFEAYQLVVAPSQLFQNIDADLQAGNIVYQPNTFFYEKEKGKQYFVLNETKKEKLGMIPVESVDEEGNTVISYQGPVPMNNYKMVDLYETDYTYEIKKIPLEKIIRESVHAYAKEPYHNIIINDLNEYGLEQLTYKGDQTLIAFRNYSTGHFTNLMLARTLMKIGIKGTTITEMENHQLKILINGIYPFRQDSLTSETTSVLGTVFHYNQEDKTKPGFYELVTDQNSIQFQSDEYKKNCYTLCLLNFGDDLGYRITDLTYAGDLISSIGESLTSILDKIKTMLGDFEYFYDNDGRFIFQRKRTYVNTSWSQITNNGDENFVNYINGTRRKFSFNFEGNRLISAIQNAPVLTNLKNDFVVWGKRKTPTGDEVPIHARYSIDKKPKEYRSFSGVLYYTDEALKNPSPQNREEILNDKKQKIFYYSKKSNPLALELDYNWWELSDWAEYYELLVGAPPTQEIYKYIQRGLKQETIRVVDQKDVERSITLKSGEVITKDFLYKTMQKQYSYLKDPQTGDFINYIPFREKIDPEDFKDQILYDEDGNEYIRDEEGEVYRIPPIMYQDALKMCKKYHLYTYIYQPTIPDDILKDNPLFYETKDPLVRKVDWRELIYQMALDYFAGQGCSESEPIYNLNDEVVLTTPDHFLSKVAELNPYYYPTGYTGYEQYYTDMEGFWRQLYNPDYIAQEVYQAGSYNDKIDKGSSNIYFRKYKEWSDSYVSDYNVQYYFSDIDLINIQKYKQLLKSKQNNAVELIQKYNKYYLTGRSSREDKKRLYWNASVFENPESLNFWIDFLDDEYELAQFSVPMVGDRTKVVNEDKAGAIIFKEIPDIILYDKFKDENKTELDRDSLRNKLDEVTGYTWVYLPKGFSQYFTISYRNMSVKNKIDELLYQYAYCIENITITALPIYYLQPNTRIYVQDKTTNINGEYIVSKITLPLSYDGTMSITATKAPERLY